jgi:hypothetical protein
MQVVFLRFFLLVWKGIAEQLAERIVGASYTETVIIAVVILCIRKAYPNQAALPSVV